MRRTASIFLRTIVVFSLIAMGGANLANAQESTSESSEQTELAASFNPDAEMLSDYCHCIRTCREGRGYETTLERSESRSKCAVRTSWSFFSCRPGRCWD